MGSISAWPLDSTQTIKLGTTDGPSNVQKTSRQQSAALKAANIRLDLNTAALVVIQLRRHYRIERVAAKIASMPAAVASPTFGESLSLASGKRSDAPM
jgi:hypothetical protein